MKNKITESGIKLLLLFPVLFLFSCHSSDQQNAESSNRTDTVTIQQMQFIPASLTVQKGDTIIWINKDMVDHTVKEEKSKGFYSDTIHVGNIWKMEATDNADYNCSIHPTMKGKIVIK
ncbi:MAG: plastocyanin/azurin family copper-binding protein [Ginsengibacter sp.]